MPHGVEHRYIIHTCHRERICWHADFPGFLAHLACLPDGFVLGYEVAQTSPADDRAHRRYLYQNRLMGMTPSAVYLVGTPPQAEEDR